MPQRDLARARARTAIDSNEILARERAKEDRPTLSSVIIATVKRARFDLAFGSIFDHYITHRVVIYAKRERERERRTFVYSFNKHSLGRETHGDVLCEREKALSPRISDFLDPFEGSKRKLESYRSLVHTSPSLSFA